MNFPGLSPQFRLQRLEPPRGRVSLVLDTDAYNEVDDQFALVHALLSPEKLRVEAVYAAPFHNCRSAGPADGMERSFEEILRLLELLDHPAAGLVYRGATSFLRVPSEPEASDAVEDLVRRAMARSVDDPPLYVVAIGAATNVASALLCEPRIIERIVVVWLGGHAFHWPHTKEFNLYQDIPSARILFDSGVPLVHVPCMGVASHLLTTVAELDRYVGPCGAVGAYLARIVREYTDDPFAWSKVIWDVAAVSYLLDPDWVPTHLVHSPIVTDQGTWSFDTSRHLIRSAVYVQRDPIFRDLFSKLGAERVR